MTLERHVGIAARDLVLEQDGTGRPTLQHECASTLQFNVSHSGDWVLIGVSEAGRIGVDVERLRSMEDADAIAGRFFAPAEAKLVHGREGSEKVNAFFSIWTCKEAYVKALGVGLGRALNDFTVVLDGTSSASVDSHGEEPEEGVPSTIWRAEPAPGYLAAVALGSPSASLQAWYWTGAGGLSRWAST